MNNDFTDITIVLDRSSSMAPLQLHTIGGFNRFLADQKKLPGQCQLSLVQFDDQYEPNYSGKLIAAVSPLTTETYQPRGSTALLDAVAKTINITGARLKGMTEAERPAKVVFVIMTDGYENASQEYTKEKVKEMIQHQKDAYKWDFVFMGANQNAIFSAAGMNIAGNKAMTYGATGQGVADAYGTMSSYVNMARSAATENDFLDNLIRDIDRQKQKDAGAV